MNEAEIQQLIQIDSRKVDCVLMRNNSGAFKDESGRIVRFGLDNTSKARNELIKSSDLIGFTLVTVTPEMVGQQLAVFTAVECKAPNWKPSASDKRERAQRTFVDWVKTNYGFAGFADSIESFRKILGR